MKNKNEPSSSLLSENNFTQINNLQQYLSDQNKILNHKVTQNSIHKHKKIVKQIKQARQIGLLSFTSKYD